MPARPPATGDAIAGFRLGAPLRGGGMGSLWEVDHPDHPGPLLMKLPSLARGDDAAAVVSFEMEQMILPRLSGPHVPRFVAAAGFEVQPFLVMERIPGDSLLPVLRALPRPAAEVAATGARVADALEGIHRQHVAHLDVKPANILFRPGPGPAGDARGPGDAAPRPAGEAVLVDFGLSHHARLPDLIEEEFRLPYGSAPYMAPEQLLGLRSERRSDLYALGVVLYQLATGTLPFGQPPHIGAARSRLWRDPAPPRRLRPDCPPWLQEVILRCLEVDPADRHPTAAQLALDLRNPGQVRLTARAERTRRDGFLTVLERRLDRDAPARRVRAARAAAPAPAAPAPIVALAVDLSEDSAPLTEALRATVAHVLRTLPGARLACINVVRHGLLGGDDPLDARGRPQHVGRLADLHRWTSPMRIAEGRITHHVLDGASPAAALLDYAAANHVDHIILGAGAPSALRAVLGAVAGEVAAKAPCTVTVVRARVGR